MINLSFREKVLLLVLGVVVILIGGFTFLVIPLQSENAVLEAKVQISEDEKQLMETTIQSNPQYLSTLALSQEAIQVSLSQISDPIDRAWYDDTLTDFAQKAGISITQISYQEAALSFPEVNYNVKTEVSSGLLAEIDKINKQEVNEDPSKAAEFEILRYPVEVTFTGSKEKTAHFIKQLYADQETIYVSSLNYDYESMEGSVQIDIYSIDKIDNTDILSSNSNNNNNNTSGNSNTSKDFDKSKDTDDSSDSGIPKPKKSK